ncbi:dihydrodipicolinate synthase family protein [Amycolatopsis sp. NEAU-NG30]|uniref:Dihydrodipicolinate synthase family protein n=1 Tax=Amycolatopsis melonis TaxID=3156488 RepID=A0ABV0LTI3_9PSEU
MPRAEVISATPTLFRDDGALDEAANAALLNRLRDRVDGVFVAGTTGEFPALDRAERRVLATLALEIFGPARTVVHVGAASTRDAVALAADAVAAGATRLAVITPYYLPADAGTVRRHFAAVTAAAGDAEVYGYLFPDRTGVTVTPAEFASIAAATGLSGGKLSGAAAARFPEYLAAFPEGRFWSGADAELAAVARAGGAGVVSGLSSAFPEPFMELAAGEDAQARVDEVRAALGGTIEGIKEALRRQGIGNGLLRMPAPAPDVERIAALGRYART